MIQSYKDLKVWQKSIDLAVKIYEVTKRFPKEELYGLVSQMRRAAFSIPSNIAEGYCRKHLRDYIRFLGIAYGSAAELETQLIISKKIKLVKKESFSELTGLTQEIMKMLYILMRRLEGNR